MRGIGVGKEGGDDAGFGEDFAIEVDGGDKTALGGMLVHGEGCGHGWGVKYGVDL